MSSSFLFTAPPQMLSQLKLEAAELGIGFDGKSFLAGGHRYGRLDDALNCVRH